MEKLDCPPLVNSTLPAAGPPLVPASSVHRVKHAQSKLEHILLGRRGMATGCVGEEYKS